MVAQKETAICEKHWGTYASYGLIAASFIPVGRIASIFTSVWNGYKAERMAATTADLWTSNAIRINQTMQQSYASISRVGQVEQYALRAKSSGFYPVYARGYQAPTELKWLDKGDVWKFGTTKNPTTRYPQSFYKNTGEYGLYYSKEFVGTNSQAITVQNMKIRNYMWQNDGVLPAGNKIIN